MGQRKGLAAVLVAGNLGNDLCGYIAGRKKAVRLFDQCFTDNRAVLKHILQIDKVTVVLPLCKIIRIMEMDNALLMGSHDLLWQQHTAG